MCRPAPPPRASCPHRTTVQCPQPNNQPVPTVLPPPVDTGALRSDADLLPASLSARLDALDVQSRKVFSGKLQGERRSKRRGRSVEFDDFRDYARLPAPDVAQPIPTTRRQVPPDWTDYKPDFYLLNGRCYPDTLAPNGTGFDADGYLNVPAAPYQYLQY